MALHKLLAVTVGDTFLPGITAHTVSPGGEVRGEVSAGAQFPTAVFLSAVRPRITMTSKAVAAVMAVTGTAGAEITSATPLKIYLAELDAFGQQMETGKIITATDGLLVPRQLRLSHRQDATLTLEAVLRSPDGSAAPLADESGAMPAAPTLPADDQRHTLQSLSVGVGDLGCLADVAVDFGVNVDSFGCSSDLYDKHITAEQGTTPTLTATAFNVDQAAALKFQTATEATHANASLVLRRYDASQSAGFVTDELTLTFDGVTNVDSITADGPATAQIAIRTTCRYDGTNHPIIISA